MASDTTDEHYDVEIGYRFITIKPTDRDKFVCQIDGEDVPLVAVGEIVNLADAGMVGEVSQKASSPCGDTSEKVASVATNEEYVLEIHWSIHVAADHVCEAYKRRAMGDHAYEDPDCVYRPADAHGYGGGVPFGVYDSVDKDKQVEVDHIAVKSGERTVPRFAGRDAIREYVEGAFTHRLRGVEGLIGFYLDKTVNRMGTTGWDMIEEQIDPDAPGLKAGLERMA